MAITSLTIDPGTHLFRGYTDFQKVGQHARRDYNALWQIVSVMLLHYVSNIICNFHTFLFWQIYCCSIGSHTFRFNHIDMHETRQRPFQLMRTVPKKTCAAYLTINVQNFEHSCQKQSSFENGTLQFLSIYKLGLSFNELKIVVFSAFWLDSELRIAIWKFHSFISAVNESYSEE